MRTNEEQITLAKNLSRMIKAGFTLSRSLSVLKKQTRNSKFNKILVSAEKDINSGETFSFALSKFPDVFSKLFVSMVRAGEESETLAGVLSDIGLNLEKSNFLTRKIRRALIYPSICFSVGFIFLGNFFSNDLISTFIIFLGGIFGLYVLFRSKFMAAYLDFIVLKIPIVSKLTKELNTARTARAISSLLFSGVSISQALEITTEVVPNIYYKEALDKAKIAIKKGEPLSKVFGANLNLYPIMVSEMVQIGEETGKLSEMLLEIALFYEEEVENRTKNLSTIFESLLMAMIGAAACSFVVSMII